MRDAKRTGRHIPRELARMQRYAMMRAEGASSLPRACVDTRTRPAVARMPAVALRHLHSPVSLVEAAQTPHAAAILDLRAMYVLAGVRRPCHARRSSPACCVHMLSSNLQTTLAVKLVGLRVICHGTKQRLCRRALLVLK